MKLQVSNLSVALRGQPLLHDISAQFGPGLHGIVGPNGAGKSTLLRAVAGLLPNASGAIHLDADDVWAMDRMTRAGQLVYLAQNPVPHWPVSVRTLVALSRSARRETPHSRDQAVARALHDTGMAELVDRNVLSLSGGERARALLAHAFAAETPVMLVDEPAAALDPAWAVHQMALLQQRAHAGACILCVLHDMQFLNAFADTVLVLDGGRVLAHGKPETVLADGTLQRAFGVAFEANGAMVFPSHTAHRE